MGYNRSGKRRTQKMKRAKKDYNRLVAKLVAAEKQSQPAAATVAVKP